MVEKKYFAKLNADKLAGNLLDRARTFYQNDGVNEYLNKIADSWRFYHGMFNTDIGFSNHTISFTGEQGELVSLPVNEYRNIADHIIRMITATRPSLQARAINSDYKSLAQTILANGILDYYMRERRLEDAVKTIVEMAVVMGSAFLKLEWNATAGEQIDFDEETNQYIYDGDIQFTTLTPFDVVFDGTKETYRQDWVLTRSFKNKYDVAAKFPELAHKIENLPSKSDYPQFRLTTWSNDQTDDIPVYEFFHARTESMPEGRYLLFLEQEIVLMDTPLPYRSIPVFRMAPANILGTPYGYTGMFDLFPLQEAVNSLYSTILTNQNAFGVQNVFIEHGSDLTVTSVEGAMKIIQGNKAPVPLNLTQTSPETFTFMAQLIQTMERLSGVNSVTRGNPESSLKTGAALALVQSMAIQFLSGLQQSYVRFLEEVGTTIITYLKDFANSPRTAVIVGKNNKSLLKEFTGESLSTINRVVVDVGNPLSKTTAGRVEMAQQMTQMGLITNPKQYLQVINTGNLETLYDSDEHELLLVKQENEKLANGDLPLVAPTDAHRMHIMEHKAVLADSDVRDNPDYVKNVNDHIQMHLDALRNVDPALLQLIGEQPLPPPGMPPEPVPGAEGGEEGGVDGEMVGNPNLPPTTEQITGEVAEVPAPATPPKPFQDLPTDPAQVPTN